MNQRAGTNPFRNPALGCELTMRERMALMTLDDWDDFVDIALARTATQ